MELYTIIVGKLDEPHEYWKPQAFVALVNNDWGPSPTLDIVVEPMMFLTFKEAQDVINEHHFIKGINLEVATFKLIKGRRKRK